MYQVIFIWQESKLWLTVVFVLNYELLPSYSIELSSAYCRITHVCPMYARSSSQDLFTRTFSMINPRRKSPASAHVTSAKTIKNAFSSSTERNLLFSIVKYETHGILHCTVKKSPYLSLPFASLCFLPQTFTRDSQGLLLSLYLFSFATVFS